jgi:hypothetical protein
MTILDGSSLSAEDDFAVGDDEVVEGEAIAVGAGIEAGAQGAAHEADAGRGLEDVRGEGGALGVEFNFEVAGVGVPDDLVAGIEDDGFGEDADQDNFFGHLG